MKSYREEIWPASILMTTNRAYSKTMTYSYPALFMKVRCESVQREARRALGGVKP